MKDHAKEIWKEVIGYEGIYEVSNLGRVKSLDRNVEVNIPKQPIRKVKY
ncbi:NUMOD4 domain-containing protein [Ekhidna sp.]